MPLRQEIVITGLGLVCPLGIGSSEVWPALEAGKSGVRTLSRLEPEGLPMKIGGELPDFNPKPYLPNRKVLKLMSRDIQLAVASAALAYEDGKLDDSSVAPERIGVSFGAHTMMSDLADLEQVYQKCVQDGKFQFSEWGEGAMGSVFPLWMLKYLPNMPACHIAIYRDARGPNNSIIQNEISSLLAFNEAIRVIERDRADVMITGGTGVKIHYIYSNSWHRYESYSKQTEHPEQACRPFDQDRDGQVAGEGSACFLLETKAHAKDRGIPILAEVLGYGVGTEHVPHGKKATGKAIQLAIQNALKEADLSPEQIDYVNAHGLSTVVEDELEARAIQSVLGDTPITAFKSYFGNASAGSGALELAISLLALQKGKIPPTLNYETPDPACPVNVISGEFLEVKNPICLKLSFTQAGQAVALIVGARD
ncbi:Beta-ketoacyl-acyl-carrier-protein synthase II [Planctomycetales bacterium 10988]|nr:Beta-ketoacyl-acyl-carrier-protein synthase II [Planctomycetales bacterium 10988]